MKKREKNILLFLPFLIIGISALAVIFFFFQKPSSPTLSDSLQASVPSPPLTGGTLPPSRATATLQAVVYPGILTITPIFSQSVTTPLVVEQSTYQRQGRWNVGFRVVDTRGSGAGWNVSMDLEHLTMTGAVTPAEGNTGPPIQVSPSYRYQGWWGRDCSITITVRTSGTLGTANFRAALTPVTEGALCSDTFITPERTILALRSNTDIGGGRLLLDFSEGNYKAGDRYTILFDMINYRQCTATPNVPVDDTSTSSTTNVRPSSAQKITGTSVISRQHPILSANVGYGMGAYQENVQLSCEIHQNAKYGSYRGFVSFTVL